MEASQPRVKPIRASEPEPVSVRQSLPVGDANRRELPPRENLGAEPTLPIKRKAQTKSHRSSQRKPVMTVRQQWVGQQQLLANEMQQLESQAERINQRLAERSMLARSLRPPPEPEIDRSLAPVAQPNPQSETRSPMLEDEEAERLQAQLGHIRQILADLETTIAEGELPSELASELPDELPNELSSEAQPSPPAPEKSSGNQAGVDQGTAPAASSKGANFRQANPGLAEQEAVQTAATLRHLADKARSISATPTSATPTSNSSLNSSPTLQLDSPPNSPPDLSLSHEWIPFQDQPQQRTRVRRSRRRRKFQLANLLPLPQRPVDRVVDALIWIVLAAGVRIGMRLLLVAVPALGTGAIGLMALPAAIGVFLVLFVPKAGYLPVYRLFLITLGLLLGGKL